MRRGMAAIRSPSGASAIELTVAITLFSIVLAGAVVSVQNQVALRELRGWSDTVVNDLRATQQLGITRRAPAVVTFTARVGSVPANYAARLGGTTVRQQTLPPALDVTPATIQFSTLGGSLSPLPVTVTLSHDRISRTRTVTVVPVSGVVMVSQP